jgi:Ca2+-dependent lipid-binding protein
MNCIAVPSVSDDTTPSDLIGRISIPLKELMSVKNKMVRRSDELVGFEAGDKMDGKLHWSVGYFDKIPLKKELEKLSEEVPPTTKTAPEMEMLPGDKGPNPAQKDLPPLPPDVQRTPPDTEFPSGVLSVVVHQVCLNLLYT